MSKNIVLIPCYQRSDFLAAMLDYIKDADGCDRNHYIFLLDRNHSGEVKKVADSFPLEKTIRVTKSHPYHGNSYNVLEGYKFAQIQSQGQPKRLVYLVEEDIFIGKDFFTFHENVQSKYNPFCVSAVVHHANDKVYPHEPNAVYEHFHYQSLGVSFKVERLPLFTCHATPQYYNNMTRYCQLMFPHARLGSMWTEQDGVLNRVVDKYKMKCIYPYVPRAFHAGFVGYNRSGTSLEGSLADKVAKLKTMSNEEMNDHAKSYKDIHKIDVCANYAVTDFVLKEA